MKEFYHSIQKNKCGKEGEFVKFSVYINMNIYGWINEVKLRLKGYEKREIVLNYKNKDDKYAYFETELFMCTRAIYKYKFSFISEKEKYKETKEFKMSVGFYVPDWAKGAVMYQIFIDRFYRDTSVKIEEFGKRKIHKNWNDAPILGPDENGEWNTDSFGGNFNGIKKKLDYIKSLGTDIIYLSPISQSSSNHKYDGEDLEEIDPYFGGEEDFKSLCDEIHKQDMKVMVDVVFNHVGKDSKYFNEGKLYNEIGACQSKESKYFPFFKTTVENGKIVFSYWWGIKDLVVCNKESKEWQEYICGKGGIIDQLFAYGIDAIRIDVADELPDDFITLMREACHRCKEDSFILGEIWKKPVNQGRGYLENGTGVDSIMNYYFVSALIDYLKYQNSQNLYNKILEIFNEYPEDTILTAMNFTSTHDISRGANIFSPDVIFKDPQDLSREWAWSLKTKYEMDKNWQSEYELSEESKEYAKKILKLYIFILAFWPGIISIFYGDEVGICGAGNLANRKTFPWDNMDKDMLFYVQKVLKTRKEYDFLRIASYPEILELTEDKFMFKRKNKQNEILVIVNNGYTDIKVEETGSVILSYNYDSSKNVIHSKGAIALVTL